MWKWVAVFGASERDSMLHDIVIWTRFLFYLKTPIISKAGRTMCSNLGGKSARVAIKVVRIANFLSGWLFRDYIQEEKCKCIYILVKRDSEKLQKTENMNNQILLAGVSLF